MRKVVLMSSVCLLMSGVGQLCNGVAEAANSTIFVCEKFRFSVGVPMGWRASLLAPTGLPMFINFPFSKLSPRGFDLPVDGARIHIYTLINVPRSRQFNSLDEWADFFKNRAVESTIRSSNFEMPQASEVARALRVSFDESTEGDPPEQQQHDVTVYWEFHGERFATTLVYIVGDPKFKQYESRLETLMRSIRPLPPVGEGKRR